MRDRLIELLKSKVKFRSIHISLAEKFSDVAIETIADHLLANGVILPPVWVGSTVYYIYDLLGEMCSKEMSVVECTFDEQGLYSLRAETFDHRISLPFSRKHPYYSLNTLRFTKEEAEKALKERSEE